MDLSTPPAAGIKTKCLFKQASEPFLGSLLRHHLITMGCNSNVDTSQLEIGHIIWYKPKSDVFAQTTGAQKAQPKRRPCVIVGVQEHTKAPILTPITTAKRTEQGKLYKHPNVSPSACVEESFDVLTRGHTLYIDGAQLASHSVLP